MNGSMVKNYISCKMGFGYSATRRTSPLSWFQACQRVRAQDLISQLQGHLQDRRVTNSSGNETRERENRIESDISPVTVSTTVDDRSGQPVVDQANKTPKTN